MNWFDLRIVKEAVEELEKGDREFQIWFDNKVEKDLEKIKSKMWKNE